MTQPEHFSEHELRQALNDEFHARPPVPLESPQLISYLAFHHEDESPAAARQHVATLGELLGQPIDPAGAHSIAPKTLNIKSITLEKAKTIGTINANQEFDVLGYTNTKTKWAAISNEGVIIGFVPLNNIVAIGKIASTTSSSTLMAKSVEIPINGMCREVSQSIQQNGETSKDGTISRKACVQADDKWYNA